jgi:hypothetical protein
MRRQTLHSANVLVEPILPFSSSPGRMVANSEVIFVSISQVRVIQSLPKKLQGQPLGVVEHLAHIWRR